MRPKGGIIPLNRAKIVQDWLDAHVNRIDDNFDRRSVAALD